MRHEVSVLQGDMRLWSTRCRPALVLDLHAPGATEHGGIYTFAPDPDTHAEAHSQSTAWSHVIAESLGPDYAAEDFVRVARYASRWEAPRVADFARDQLKVPMVTLEVPYGRCGATVMTQKHYREAGRRIGKALLHKLREKG